MRSCVRFHTLEVDYPMVSLALNADALNGWFYLHMKTDLPVLIADGAIDMLSAEEIRMASQQLRDCSDQLEQMVFGADQDLSKDDLAVSGTLAGRDVGRPRWPVALPCQHMALSNQISREPRAFSAVL